LSVGEKQLNESYREKKRGVRLRLKGEKVKIHQRQNLQREKKNPEKDVQKKSKCF